MLNTSFLFKSYILLFPDHTYEKELVEKIIDGDMSAFREMFFRYKDKLLSFCYRFTKCEAVAEEIVHDVLLKIWMEREQIDPHLSFNSYLYSITRNHALNFLKKAAIDNSLREKLYHYFDKHHQKTEDQLVYADLEHIAGQAIALLPPQRQLVYQMSRKQSMSHEEIAYHLGISKHTVRNHMVEALKAIRNYLNIHADMNICIANTLYIFFI